MSGAQIRAWIDQHIVRTATNVSAKALAELKTIADELDKPTPNNAMRTAFEVLTDPGCNREGVERAQALMEWARQAQDRFSKAELVPEAGTAVFSADPETVGRKIAEVAATAPWGPAR